MIIWLIGLSGSGKTTLAKQICSVLKAEQSNWVLIDGDMVRAISGNDLGHTVDDRWRNAQRVSRLCLELDRQEINVVCAILSIFHQSQKWNRENFGSYKEIFLDVSMDTLLRRDPRGLYARALDNQEKNVVGVDLEFPPPYAPDLIINNDRDGVDMGVLARKTVDDLEIDVGTGYRYSTRNLLEHPEKYEYSQYQGARFLDSYCQSRSRAIEVLTGKVERIEDSYALDSSSHPWVEPLSLSRGAASFLHTELGTEEPGREPSEQVETRPFLCQSLDAALANGATIDLNLVFGLVRRFEVSKKVYEAYTLPNFRPASNPSQSLIDYGLFGTLLATLAQRVEAHQKLILFNSLLKVNDILISALGLLCTPTEHYLALASLRKEQEVFLPLYHQHVPGKRDEVLDPAM